MPRIRDRSSEPADPQRTLSSARRLLRSRDGAAAIEFALLAIPYFLIVFAIIETFVAYTGEQLIGNAVDTMARQMRTGEIKNDTKESDFRAKFCEEISILIQCSGGDSDRLILDVRSFSTYADIPTTIPRVGGASFGALAATNAYQPGGSGTINMLRAYYRWEIITDLVRPYISNIRPADGSLPKEFLIVATATYKNEDY
jgi:Flp pilus assembly protein TadG